MRTKVCGVMSAYIWTHANACIFGEIHGRQEVYKPRFSCNYEYTKCVWMRSKIIVNSIFHAKNKCYSQFRMDNKTKETIAIL